MKSLIKKLLSKLFTIWCLKGVTHGKNCKCNFYCKFTKSTVVGENCHFNGINISGYGNVKIGSNFHSGKRVHILTSYHNYDGGTTLPYDDTYITKDVLIGPNVWICQDVTILAGVCIGDGAIIQAGSVVCSDIPALGIAGGHPAKVFKWRDKSHYLKLNGTGHIK